MKIEEFAAELKLPHIKRFHQEIIEEAVETNLNFEEFLHVLLSREYEHRKNKGIQNRIKAAGFPNLKYLKDFDCNKYPPHLIQKLNALETLAFIENKENVFLMGSPGSGKSHLAIGLTVKSIYEGKSALFTSVAGLITQLSEMQSQRKFIAYKKKFEKYDLVVLDDLGYLSFERSEAELLFNLLSNRNDKGSLIITSTLPPDRWHEVFLDNALSRALIERMSQRTHILDLSS